MVFMLNEMEIGIWWKWWNGWMRRNEVEMIVEGLALNLYADEGEIRRKVLRTEVVWASESCFWNQAVNRACWSVKWPTSHCSVGHKSRTKKFWWDFSCSHLSVNRAGQLTEYYVYFSYFLFKTGSFPWIFMTY